jgi:hypothetical protein
MTISVLARRCVVPAVAGALFCVAACGDTSPNAWTGLGAPSAVWKTHHDGAYSSVLTDWAGRVSGYVLTLAPTPLDQATAQVRRDLPADTTASPARSMVGIEATKCEIVEFHSVTLQRVFGEERGGDVIAAFEAENATVMDTDRIVHVVVVSGTENIPQGC